MKNIKRIIIFSLILLGSLLSPALLQANEPARLLFAVTPYQPLQNLDFFFTHSVHKLAYYEESNTNTHIKTPVFLSIITQDQKQEYINAGYNPVIVDENAADIERYYVVYSKEADQSNKLTNPVFKDQGLELVYPVTEYATLIKLSPGVEFRNLDISGLHKFRARKFFVDMVPPVDRTTIGNASIISPTLTAEQIENAETNGGNQPLAIALLIIIIAFLSHTLIYKKKNHK